MKRSPLTGSTSAEPTEGSATQELVCIPVGPLTVPLPESLADVVAGPAPWPVILCRYRESGSAGAIDDGSCISDRSRPYPRHPVRE